MDILNWYYHMRLKPWLFEQSKDDNEIAHELMLKWLQKFEKRPWLCRLLQAIQDASSRRTCTDVMGLPFQNPIILAAGVDKNCEAWNALSILGPGGIEHGGVVPEPQPGNDRPRLYRHEDISEIDNSQGFPSHGMEVVRSRVEKLSRTSVLHGCNLGKNRDTPLENTADDMCATMECLYSYFDWFTINVSSPNTVGLRDAQTEEALEVIASRVVALSFALSNRLGIPMRPIRVKIAPDVPNDLLVRLLAVAIKCGVKCVVLGNTRLSALPDGRPAGRSGPSQYPRTLEMVEIAAPILHEAELFLSACGGISTVRRAIEVLRAGADTVEILTTLFFNGPGQVRRMVKGISRYV